MHHNDELQGDAQPESDAEGDSQGDGEGDREDEHDDAKEEKEKAQSSDQADSDNGKSEKKDKNENEAKENRDDGKRADRCYVSPCTAKFTNKIKKLFACSKCKTGCTCTGHQCNTAAESDTAFTCGLCTACSYPGCQPDGKQGADLCDLCETRFHLDCKTRLDSKCEQYLCWDHMRQSSTFVHEFVMYVSLTLSCLLQKMGPRFLWRFSLLEPPIFCP